MNCNMVAEVNNENTSNTDSTGPILHYFNEIPMILRDTIDQLLLYHMQEFITDHSMKQNIVILIKT